MKWQDENDRLRQAVMDELVYPLFGIMFMVGCLVAVIWMAGVIRP